MLSQHASESFSGRVGLQQRVFPAYRAAFFDALARACHGGLSLFAGRALAEENILPGTRLEDAVYFPAHNFNLFPITSPIYQCWQRGILAWLEDYQPNALIVEANSRYPTTRLAIRWMHRRSRPVLGWGLGAPAFQTRRVHEMILAPWRQFERSSLLRSLDGIVAYSQRGADEYRAAGIPANRVFVAPNAMTPRPQKPPPARPPVFDGRPHVLFVGRLQARKRIDHLLEACAALPLEIQPRLTIVGDGPARSDFETLANSIYPTAQFAGAKQGPELEPYFLDADLFVLPGTGGLAVQQAMAYGLPVIVAQGDGTQDDLVRPGSGLLLPPENLTALTNALQSALADPVRLRKMGAEAYRVVAEEVNLETMVRSFVHALRTVAG